VEVDLEVSDSCLVALLKIDALLKREALLPHFQGMQKDPE
jgi:hypothetical protein